MLQKLNDRIQGLLAWVIISLIAVTFALFGIDYYMQSRTHPEVQVTVNGQPITSAEFELYYRRARQASEASLSAESEKKLRSDILQEMVLNKISLDAAIKAGFTVSPDLVAATIRNIPQFQKDGKFSLENYQQALGSNFYTPQSFQREVQLGMILNQQRFGFIGTAFVLPDELNRYINLSMQSRNYDYLLIPYLSFLKPALISENEIAQYYQDNPEEFKTDEKVNIEYVRLSMNDIKENIKISDQQIKNFYKENKLQKPFDEVKSQIKEQIVTDMAQVEYAKQLEILSDLSYQTPDTLTPVAENLNLKIQKSQPFSSAGGQEDISKNQKVVDAAFSNDVLGLGNNSDPIQLDSDSVVVIRVLNKFPVRRLTLDEVKGQIREKLALQQAQVNAKKLGQELLTVDPKKREQIIAANNLKWQQIEQATRENYKASQNINDLAFNLSPGKQAGVVLSGGDFVIVNLHKINQGDINTLTNEQKNNLIAELQSNFGQIDYELYIKNLATKAKIETKK